MCGFRKHPWLQQEWKWFWHSGKIIAGESQCLSLIFCTDVLLYRDWPVSSQMPRKIITKSKSIFQPTSHHWLYLNLELEKQPPFSQISIRTRQVRMIKVWYCFKKYLDNHFLAQASTWIKEEKAWHFMAPSWILWCWMTIQIHLSLRKSQSKQTLYTWVNQ